MIIYLAWDTSGSMEEWGKIWIARGVARSIEQYLRLGYGNGKLRLVAWGKEARIFDWCADKEFPSELLVSEGTANPKALISLLKTAPAGKVLLLTDGFWPQADASEFSRWKGQLQPNTLRIIKIGADANPHLKGNDVFSAEDLFSALDGWTERSAL